MSSGPVFIAGEQTFCIVLWEVGTPSSDANSAIRLYPTRSSPSSGNSNAPISLHPLATLGIGRNLGESKTRRSTRRETRKTKITAAFLAQFPDYETQQNTRQETRRRRFCLVDRPRN